MSTHGQGRTLSLLDAALDLRIWIEGQPPGSVFYSRGGDLRDSAAYRRVSKLLDEISARREKAATTDPVYFTDTYPRAGCALKVVVTESGFAIETYAPNGRMLEAGPCVMTPRAIGRVVEEWCAGYAPRGFDRLDHSPSGPASSASTVTE